MTADEFFSAELAKFEARWRETRDLRAVAAAFDLCALNSIALPDWMHPVIRQSLASAFAENGPDGDPGRGGYRDIAKRLDIHEKRHSVAAWGLQLRDSGELSNFRSKTGKPFASTRQGAFAFASDFLRGSDARGAPSAIEKSFNRIQARRRRTNTPQ